MIGMAGLADPGAMQGFVDTFGIDFPNTVSEDGRLWATDGVGIGVAIAEGAVERFGVTIGAQG